MSARRGLLFCSGQNVSPGTAKLDPRPLHCGVLEGRTMHNRLSRVVLATAFLGFCAAFAQQWEGTGTGEAVAPSSAYALYGATVSAPASTDPAAYKPTPSRDLILLEGQLAL